MATTTSFKKHFDQSKQRTFSVSIRKEVVRKIENNLLTVTEACINYQVSRTSVYNWVYKYNKSSIANQESNIKNHGNNVRVGYPMRIME